MVFFCKNDIREDMNRISELELKEIISSYGLNDLVFDIFKQAEPDTALYIFHDNGDVKYCLIVADFLDDNIEFPCDFRFNYYLDTLVRFRATHALSYIKDAKKRAVGYVDDNHYRTMANNGDVCMLFVIDELEV